ncbi:PREDICTED: uncharacterized protein LOC104605638 isoform X2 [Nelumbo nucifera]|nr:PREDICTED: uncharacterized protein LOC104605638 isoform X2 [Nelumbo nucifera]
MPCPTRDHIMSPVSVALEYKSCEPCEDDHDVRLQDIFITDVSSTHAQRITPTYMGLKTACANAEFFCFPSTLPGFLSEEDNLEFSKIQGDVSLHGRTFSSGMLDSSASHNLDNGRFKLLNGRIVSCSLNSGKEHSDISYPQNNNVDRNHLASCKGHRLISSTDKSLEAIKRSDAFVRSSSPRVEINPPSLDWGQKYLYFPSLAFLTVANTFNDGVLHVYEPFSTDTQFYPCDFDELLLGPGEAATICFVFLPRWLGLTSAHLVIQTSFGGFLVHAKGFAVESPYNIQHLVGLDISSGEKYRQNLSLYNPFDNTLNVEEVVAWISVSSGNTSYSAEASCKLESSGASDELNSFLNVKELLEIKNGQAGLLQVGIRPRDKWEIDPQSTEAIMEIDFSSTIEGKIFGALCLQLQGSSMDRIDTLIVPIESEVHGKAAYSGLTGLVSMFLEALVPCDSSEAIDVALSFRNGAPDMLRIVGISEVSESVNLFKIKYMEGLILFPGTVTKIAVVTYNPPTDPPPDISNMYLDCKLLIVTNSSVSPQIEIPCQDVVHTCLRHQSVSYTECELYPEKEQPAYERAGDLGGSIPSPSQFNALKIAEVDELVLKNWRSQGTKNGMSVLDDHEILFPMVQVGTHCSKWITVKNPSKEPVVMQLILNSVTVIDQCKTSDMFLQPSFSFSLVLNSSTAPTKYGFSITETAVTEAYVHPNGTALFGPIVFYPSHRCLWRSSALIRNNLSGVEWLPLRGFGGSVSLVLIEGSKPVQSLEFNLNMPIPLNISPQSLFHKDDTSSICSQPLVKELFAKNIGDLPLVVKRIEVSGTDCQLDGFMVHTCKGFALEPGESTRLLISFETDFTAAVVHRDLELALATGIFVIPMKASLPVDVFNLCRRSLLHMLLIKFSVLFVAASLLFLIFCCIFPQPMSLVAVDCYLLKSEKTSIITIGRAGKPSRSHHNQRNNISSMCSNGDNMIRSVREDETTDMAFIGRYSDCPSAEQGLIASHTKLKQGNQERTINVSEPQKEALLFSSSSVSKSAAFVESSSLVESPQTGNLTVRIEKEKGRRRRKKKPAGVGAGLTGALEVSSSQSGNSTPSSPLSPVTSFTPKRVWPLSPDTDNAIENKSSFARLADQSHEKGQIPEIARDDRLLEPEVSSKSGSRNCLLSGPEQSSVLRKVTSKPVLLPSATFPSSGRRAPYATSNPSFLASTSAISPDARAPGSKPMKEKTAKLEKTGSVDEFRYDIWGNHFSGFHLMGRTKDVSTMISSASDGSSDSFFVRGPQILARKSQTRSESLSPKLSNCAASCHHLKG